LWAGRSRGFARPRRKKCPVGVRCKPSSVPPPRRADENGGEDHLS